MKPFYALIGFMVLFFVDATGQTLKASYIIRKGNGVNAPFTIPAGGYSGDCNPGIPGTTTEYVVTVPGTPIILSGGSNTHINSGPAYTINILNTAIAGTYTIDMTMRQTGNADEGFGCQYYNYENPVASSSVRIELYQWNTTPASSTCPGANFNLAPHISTTTGVTWAVTAGGGSVNASGVYTSGAHRGSTTVTATKNYDNGGNQSISHTFTVTNDPIISFNPPANVCSDGGNINLNAVTSVTGGATIAYSCVSGTCSGGMFLTSGGDTFLKPDFNGTSSSFPTTIRLTSTISGCTFTRDVVVQIGAGFSIDAGSNVAVCKNGANVNLATGSSNSATGSPTISWSGPAVSGTTFTTSDASIVGGNTYAVTYTVNNNSGCTKTDTKDIVVNLVPNVPTISPASPVICSGNTVTLSASGASGAVYRWYNSSGTYLNVENSSYTTPVLSTTTSFQVASRISATGCESAKATKSVTVNPTPSQPTDITSNPPSPACGNTNFTLTGVGAVTGEEYRWFNSSDVLLGTGVNLATTTLGVGTHTFKASRRNTTTGCESALRSISLVVQNSPSISTAFDSRESCSGTGSLNLNTLYGSSPTTGTWSSSNGTINSKISGSSLNLSGIAVGVYPLRYSVTSGCTSTKDVSLIISSGATTPVVNDTKICEPGVVALEVVSPNGSYQYRWYTASSGGTLLNTGTSFTSPVLSSNTTYYIEAENTSTGCVSGRDAALVTVVNIGTVNAGSDIGFCSNSGVSVNLAADASPAGGVFSGPGVTGSTFNGSALANNASYEITYTVTNNGCVKTDTRLISLGFNVVLTYDPATEVYPGELMKISHNYPTAAVTTWGFGDGQSLTHLNGNHYYYQPGKKTITVYIKQSGGCENTFTFPDAIEVLPAPIITEVEDILGLVNIFPNPFTNILSIKSDRSLNNVFLTLFDTRGLAIANQNVNLVAGENRIFEQYTSSISSGIYFLAIQSNADVKRIKLLKK